MGVLSVVIYNTGEFLFFLEWFRRGWLCVLDVALRLEHNGFITLYY
jgi:hypothetical protein